MEDQGRLCRPTNAHGLTEEQVNDFTEGEWINIVFNGLFEIDVDAEYYIGYRIYSISGNVVAAYHDAGPMIAGNGAYIYTSQWETISSTYSFNFCIKAVVVSQNSTSSPHNDISPMANYLGSNYPNPFNPSTTITFSLTTPVSQRGTAEYTENTELMIYNLKGQRVKTLDCINHVDATSSRMMYSIVWDGTDENNQPVTSGVYLYNLKTGSFEQTKKMILMK